MNVLKSGNSNKLLNYSSKFGFNKPEKILTLITFKYLINLKIGLVKQCGSSLPWAVKGGKNIVVTAGTLDDVPDIKPMFNIFWGSKASWLEETYNLPKHDKFPK